MKTKIVLPWQVKIGDKIGPFQYTSLGDTRFCKVKSIKKSKGLFTNSSMWEFDCDVVPIPRYHGKTNNLPAQKVEVLIEK